MTLTLQTGQKIKIYDLDTDLTVKARIARLLGKNILELYFPVQPLDAINSQNFHVGLLENDLKNVKDIVHFYLNVVPIRYPGLTAKDLAVFTSKYTKLDVAELTPNRVFNAKGQIPLLDERTQKMHVTTATIDKNIKARSQEIQSQTLKIQSEDLEEWTEILNFTTNLSLPNLFDWIQVSWRVPYIRLQTDQQFTKIHSSSIVDVQWIREQIDDSHIFFVIASDPIVDKIVPVAKVSVIQVGGRSRAYIRSSTDLNLTRVQLLQIFTSIFGNKISDISSGGLTNLKVRYTVDINITPWVLYDLVTNSELSTIFDIAEETIPANGKKRVNIVYTPPGSSPMTMFFTMSDQPLSIRVTKIQSSGESKNIAKVLSGLFTNYSKNEKKILKAYRKFIPGIELDAPPEKKTMRKFEALEKHRPDLFKEGFGTICQANRQPVVYPNGAPNGIYAIEFDGHWYGCPDSQFKFPGVILNSLPVNVKPSRVCIGNDVIKTPKEREQSAYLPCCFKSSQENTRKMKAYLEGKVITNRDSEYVIQTQKILDFGRFGAVPQILMDFMGMSLIRQGGMSGTSNLLSTILLALNIDFLTDAKDARDALVQKTRADLLKYRGIAAQQMYDCSVKEIIDYLENKTMDSEIWVPILEIAFDRKIVVIRRIVEKNREILVREIPRHRDGYLQWKKSYNEALVIFKTTGVSSDRSADFSYELVKSVEIRNDQILSTSAEFSIDQISNLEKLVNEFGVGNPTTIFDPLPQNPTAQYIDKSGKVRALVYGETIIHCTALPPLPISRTSLPVEKSKNSPKDYGFQILEENENFYKVKVPGGVGFSFKDDSTIHSPLVTSVNSKLAASVLRDYARWMLSQFLKDGGAFQDFENHIVSKKMQIDPYVEEAYEFSDSAPWIEGDLLRVPSKEIRKLLISTLEQDYRINSSEIREFWRRTSVDRDMSSTAFFAIHPREYIFDSPEQVLLWNQRVTISDQVSYTVSDIVKKSLYPAALLQDGKFVLVQNVFDGSVDRANAVSSQWKRMKQNPGYYTEGTSSPGDVINFDGKYAAVLNI